MANDRFATQALAPLVTAGLSQEPETRQRTKAEIQAEIGARPLAQWTAVFAELDVCVEPVLTVPEMLRHPQVQARGLVVDVPRPEGGHQPQIASPFKFSQAQAHYRHTGAAPGAHTDEVLREVGYTDRQIEALRVQGIFG